ncbi:MAG TPA: DUF4388 domain-containing protein [candidate division Zixibacteria bacterium]|nr:DUF4388 domain-containing protein [candidate division Zixibacteria bacterium]
MDLQGSIAKFTLPEIFQLVAGSRKTGTLAIQRDDAIVMVYFKEGNVVYAYGPQQTYHIGQLLKELKVLSAEQLEEAVRLQSESQNSRRLGEILISQRYIDRSDLETVVKTQIEELLYSLLAWEAGSFKFYENQHPTEEEITVRISVENVILEGLRRHDEKNMATETLPDLNAVFTISVSESNRSRDVNMNATEWNLMALVDGHRTLKEICEISMLGQDEALVRLARLKLAGIIVKTETKPVPKTEAPLDQMVDRLANLFEDYLSQKTTVVAPENRLTTTIIEEQL